MHIAVHLHNNGVFAGDHFDNAVICTEKRQRKNFSVLAHCCHVHITTLNNISLPPQALYNQQIERSWNKDKQLQV